MMRASHESVHFRFLYNSGHCFPHGMESFRLMTRRTETVREKQTSTLFLLCYQGRKNDEINK